MSFKSHQIFKIALHHLPKGRLQKIYTQKTRQIYKWAADPRFCEETARNPIDRVRILLDEINIAGYGDYAREAIDYMAAPLGGRFTDVDPATSDKDISGEIVDVAVSTGILFNLVRKAENGGLDAADRIRIKAAARKAIQEIEQLLDASGINQD